MPVTRSFGAVVWEKHSDDIEYAVSQYLDENFKSLDLSSRYVQDPDEASLAQINFLRLIPFDAPGVTVKFDVIVIADIRIYENSQSEAIEGDAQRHFRVSCEAELNDGLNGFQVKAIDHYNHRNDTDAPHGTLTDTLVPIINKGGLDEIAETIVAEHYPEALTNPTPIDVRRFAENIGLSIREVQLSRGGTIFGEMIFSDCSVDYFDVDVRRFAKLDVKQGTILVDPEAYFLRSLGSWNNTVIHECIHWLKQRKFFEFEHLYDKNIRMIRCQVAEAATDERKRPDTEWIEWQANALAPRILMPKRQFQIKADKLIAEHKRSRCTEKVTDVIESVIYELSEFFGVSIQAAKIRMIDIGYSEAIGFVKYIDDDCSILRAIEREAIKQNTLICSPPTTEARFSSSTSIWKRRDTNRYAA